MQIKIEPYKQKALNFVQRLSDVRFVGQAVFVVIVLLISWSGVKTIQTNYELQKQIAAMKQQDSVQQLENNNLTLQNEYFNSNQYLELAARQNFGLAASGEKEVLVPQNVALAYTVNLSDSTSNKNAATPPTYQHNFESWVDFLLHRQNDN